MFPNRDFVFVPKPVTVTFALEPVHNLLASLFTLAFADRRSGFDEWVEQTIATLPPERRHTHRVLCWVLAEAYELEGQWPDFPTYLEDLATQDPDSLRGRVLRWLYLRSGGEPPEDCVLEDVETFQEHFLQGYPDEPIDSELIVEAHALLSDPPTMQQTIVTHLRTMWETVLSAEWERCRPLLEKTVEAFNRRDYSGLAPHEAIQSVTGRDLSGEWHQSLSVAERLVFIPSIHVGPYLIKFAYGPLVKIVFGARLPRAVDVDLPDLSRAELLVRLRALTDVTRLRILELLVEHGELCAQDIITLLGLSQSSASRHLSQLSATGCLIEHPGGGKAKCYTINSDYLRETLRAIARHLHVDL